MSVVRAQSANSSNAKTATIWTHIKKRRGAVISAGKGFDLKGIATIFTFSSPRLRAKTRPKDKEYGLAASFAGSQSR
jgi:hypothetical protein